MNNPILKLVNEAVGKDHDFAKRWEWRIRRTKRNPDMVWLFGHLNHILGQEYVKEALEASTDQSIQLESCGTFKQDSISIS